MTTGVDGSTMARSATVWEAVMPPLVLFVCRHGAAKSVLAAAKLEQLAEAAGVTIDVRAAGIEPDAAVPPAVVDALPEEVRKNLQPPRLVTADDITAAWRTITLDLESSDLPSPPTAGDRWDGLPSAGDEPRRFLAAISPRAEALV